MLLYSDTSAAHSVCGICVTEAHEKSTGARGAALAVAPFIGLIKPGNGKMKPRNSRKNRLVYKPDFLMGDFPSRA